jgi:hypothetical protein
MRKMVQGGTCGHCGRSSPTGGYWVNVLKVLDFGVDTMLPLEPDTSVPVLCDDCQRLQSMMEHEAAGMLHLWGPLSAQQRAELERYKAEAARRDAR